MKINHGHSRMAALTLAFTGMINAAVAATGTSAEFKVDLQITYSFEMEYNYPIAATVVEVCRSAGYNRFDLERDT